MRKRKEKKKGNFFTDFKDFITKGNIFELAIAVVMGAAFGKIITSAVNELIMPLLSLALGGRNFSDLKWIIKPAEYDIIDGITVLVKNETAFGYGSFIQACVEFLIIALCIFLFVRLVMKIREGHKKKAAPPPAEEPAKITQEELLTEIRDLLKANNNSDKT